MKLGELFPEAANLNKQETTLNGLLGSMSDGILKSYDENGKYRAPTMGIDEIVNLWIRQQAAFRQQLLMDLQMIGMTVSEVRSPVNHVTNEVFRRGIEWRRKFAVKCQRCGREHEEAVEQCQTRDCSGHLETEEMCAEAQGMDTFEKQSGVPGVFSSGGNQNPATSFSPTGMGQAGLHSVPPRPGQTFDPISHRWKRIGAAQVSGAVPVDNDEEHQEDPTETCPGPHLIEPDLSQQDLIKDFLTDCNVFDQSLEEVLREFHFDLNIIDDAFLYFTKEYIRAEDGSVRSKVVGVERLNPALIEYDIDEAGLPKNRSWVCYIHREIDDRERAPGACDECGFDKVPAMYVYRHRGRDLFLLDSEILHTSKFNPSKMYGWSPLLTIFEKALTIIGMDKQLYRYFFERKMPASMVMVQTDDPEGLRTERNNLVQQMRADPNYIPMVAVSSKTGRGKVDMVRLFHTLQEMDYMPVREEIRERIASVWGVTPAWQGSPEAFGGLSTQTQQLVVMSRVVEADQRIFHEKVFPILLDFFGITDWKLFLPQPEEKAEATRMMFAGQKIAMAMQLLQIPGVQVKIRGQSTDLNDIDFEVSGKPENMMEYQERQMEKQMEMQQQQAEGGGEGGDPAAEGPPGEEGGEAMMMSTDKVNSVFQINDLVKNLNLDKATSVAQQLYDKGYTGAVVKEVAPDFSKMWFATLDGDYVANINKSGDVYDIEKAQFKNPGFDPTGNKNNTLARDHRLETAPYKPELPELDIDEVM